MTPRFRITHRIRLLAFILLVVFVIFFAFTRSHSAYTIIHTSGHISSMDFSPDSTMIVTAEVDGELTSNGQWRAPDGVTDTMVRLRTIPHGAILREFVGHTDSIWSVAFSPDGRIIASGSRDKTIKLWRVADGNILATLLPTRNETDQRVPGVLKVIFSPDGNLLASGTVDSIQLWDVQTAKNIYTIHTYGAYIAFSPDGKYILGTDDTALILWSILSGKEIIRITIDDHQYCNPIFTPDSRNVAVCLRDKTIRFFDIQSQQEVRKIPYSIALTNDGSVLVSGNGSAGNFWENADPDPYLYVWNAENGQLISKHQAHNGAIVSLSVSPNQRWLASGSVDRTIKVWDLDKMVYKAK
jgi:WD40 repeat protein